MHIQAVCLCGAHEKLPPTLRRAAPAQRLATMLQNMQLGLAAACLRAEQDGERTTHALENASCIKVPHMIEVQNGSVGMYCCIRDVRVCARSPCIRT
eukprot:960936-Alexandrium_andersonii.AAC.1